MPAAIAHARDGVFEALSRDRRIADASRRQIQTDAANAGLAHRIELGVSRFLVDHGNAARAVAQFADAVDSARIVRAVHARLHDNNPFDPQGRKKLSKLGDGRGFRCIRSVRKKRIFLRITKYVYVTIAGAGGHVERNLRPRLWRGGRCRATRSHERCDTSGPFENIATCKHPRSIGYDACRKTRCSETRKFGTAQTRTAAVLATSGGKPPSIMSVVIARLTASEAVLAA